MDRNIGDVLYFVIFGGVLIQISVFMISLCTSFFFIKADNLQSFLYFNTRKFVGYPLSLFPGFIQKMLAFVIPLAFVTYFPAQYFLKKSDIIWWYGVMYLTPVVGITLFILTCAL
jgi:ABC-2 type transport system permease protein